MTKETTGSKDVYTSDAQGQQVASPASISTNAHTRTAKSTADNSELGLGLEPAPELAPEPGLELEPGHKQDANVAAVAVAVAAGAASDIHTQTACPAGTSKAAASDSASVRVRGCTASESG